MSFVDSLKPTNDFVTKMQRKQYTDDYYPHAKIGYNAHSVMMFIIKFTILIAILNFVLDFALSYFKVDFSLTYLEQFQRLLIYLTIISIIVYLVFVFLRSRNHERSIIINDFKSRRLRKAFKKRVNVKRQYKELSNKMNDSKKSNKGEKSSKSGAPSIDDKTKLVAYKKLMKLKIFINTRKQLDNVKQLSTQARAIVKQPRDTQAQTQLKSLVDNLSDDLTAASKGKFKFGRFFHEPNRSISRAWYSSDDKYYIEPVPKKEQHLPNVSESTYSLDVFPDMREVNAQKAYAAEMWAQTQANKIEKALNNSKIKCTYEYTQVNAMMISMNFRLAEDNETPNVEKIPNLLQQYLGVRKLTTESNGSYVTVIMPLQEEYQTTVDMSSLFKQVFNHKDYQ